jgi:orotidine-5'-phosphate decarboxylase
MTYLEKLRHAQDSNHSWLCVGLDPQPDRLPMEAIWKWDEPLLPFNKAIIDATADLVCAYKPNLGFYLQWGAAGVIALERTIAYIPDHIPVILDSKIGDIGSTQGAWGRGLFDMWGVDAITVNPFVGSDAVVPLITNRPEKSVYILARTSNAAARQFQGELANAESLSAAVVRESLQWDAGDWAGHRGFVIGATYPADLATARSLAPHANFLIPGVGAQGGDLAAAVDFGQDSVAGPVISISRSIIFASAGLDFAEAARSKTIEFRDRINLLRRKEI